MKRGYFNKLKGLLGIILLAVIGCGIFYWETYGREALIYKDVIVLRDDVNMNVEINKDMLVSVKRDQKSLIDGAITDVYDIIGMESKHFIPKNAQLIKSYFDAPELVLNKDEFIFSIPNDWIKSYPSSLRRKDVVYLYPIDVRKQSIEDFNFDRNLNEAICKVVVAYVKDSANREVQTVGEDNRFDGSSNISSIEIIITMQQMNLLKECRSKGYEFIILYK